MPNPVTRPSPSRQPGTVPSVLIADDHPLFRIGLRHTLACHADVIAEVSNGPDALEQTLTYKPDVVLLDIAMPGDGIATCQQICARAPQTIIVMLLSSEEQALLQIAKNAGAHGYIRKETNPEAVIESIHNILEQPERDWFPNVDLPKLTRREAQVLTLLAQGNNKKQMGAALGISPETIKDYLRGLYRKLDVKDRLLAVNRARSLGLLRDAPLVAEMPATTPTAAQPVSSPNTVSKSSQPAAKPSKSSQDKPAKDISRRAGRSSTPTKPSDSYGLKS
ncbi:MAG: response regulator transcription factor [Deinococcota bacterium]